MRCPIYIFGRVVSNILRNMAESEHSLEKSKGQMGDWVSNIEVVKKGERSSQELPTTSAYK